MAKLCVLLSDEDGRNRYEGKRFYKIYDNGKIIAPYEVEPIEHEGEVLLPSGKEDDEECEFDIFNLMLVEKTDRGITVYEPRRTEATEAEKNAISKWKAMGDIYTRNGKVTMEWFEQMQRYFESEGLGYLAFCRSYCAETEGEQDILIIENPFLQGKPFCKFRVVEA